MRGRSTLALLTGMTAMMEPKKLEVTAPAKPVFKGVIMPKPDYKRRQKRLKMQKASRRANRK